MKKDKFIERYGRAAWERHLEQNRQWKEANPEKMAEYKRRWAEANPGQVKEHAHNQSRKGGSGYEKALKYGHTGLQGERHKIRNKHGHMWRQYKNIVAPDSQIHHSWHPGTSRYTGVALVEADQHRHGIIDVIQILEGKITLFTEKELRERGEL